MKYSKDLIQGTPHKTKCHSYTIDNAQSDFSFSLSHIHGPPGEEGTSCSITEEGYGHVKKYELGGLQFKSIFCLAHERLGYRRLSAGVLVPMKHLSTGTLRVFLWVAMPIRVLKTGCLCVPGPLMSNTFL